MHATGPKSQKFLRDVYAHGIGVGKTVPVARYLGSYHPYNNHHHTELQVRIRAAFRGYGPMGSFWSRAAGMRRYVVLVFRSMVHEILLSGLESLVLSDSEIKKLDKTCLHLGRKVLRGQACAKQNVVQADGVTVTKFHAQPNDFVWRALRLAPCKIEL